MALSSSNQIFFSSQQKRWQKQTKSAGLCTILFIASNYNVVTYSNLKKKHFNTFSIFSSNIDCREYKFAIYELNTEWKKNNPKKYKNIT